MNTKKRRGIWLQTVTSVIAAGWIFVTGCSLDKNESRPGNVFTRIGGHSGELIEPKRCVLKVVILARPFGDPALNEVIWRVADEQVVPPPERRAWEVNGLRVGRIVGDLPLEIEAMLNETAPQKKVTPINIIVPSGESTLISISETVDQASLLLNRDNRIFGSDYRAASGLFRVTPQHEGVNHVSMRLVPEIHHGPVQRTFRALPTAAPIGPQEFMINDGQQEEIIRELTTTLALEPGHIVVIGRRPEYKRSLGNFLLTQAVEHSDQRLEKVVLIWASRNLEGQGDNDDNAATTDRPKLLKRLMAPTTPLGTNKPAPPAPEIPSIDPSVPTATSSTRSAAAGASVSKVSESAKTKTTVDTSKASTPPNNPAP
jgi:hypothetical protein